MTRYTQSSRGESDVSGGSWVTEQDLRSCTRGKVLVQQIPLRQDGDRVRANRSGSIHVPQL